MQDFTCFTPCFLTPPPNDPLRFMSSQIPSPSPHAPAAGVEPPFDLVTWFELNRVRILGTLGIVCVLVIVLMVVRARRHSVATSASAALLALTPPTGPGQEPAPLDPQKLLDLSRRFAGTRPAVQARLLASGQLFADGKFAEAQSEFAAVEEAQPNGPLLGSALLGVASSLDAQGRTSDAVTAYDRVISLFPSGAPALQARLAKARLIEGTQPSQALGLLEDILKDPYAVGYQELAAAARGRLLAAHPELDVPLVSTNEVRVVAPPVSADPGTLVP